MPISFCISCGVLNNKISDVSFTNGSTDTNINIAMNTEHIGSATFKPKFSMRNVEIMTPILPNVSAKTCRNTPTNVKEKYTYEIFTNTLIILNNNVIKLACKETYLAYWYYVNKTVVNENVHDYHVNAHDRHVNDHQDGILKTDRLNITRNLSRFNIETSQQHNYCFMVSQFK